AYGRLDEFLKKVVNDRSRSQMLEKYVVDIGGRRSLLISPGHFQAVDSTTRLKVEKAADRYGATLAEEHLPAFWKIKDVVRRVFMGTGSLGVDRYFVLIDGATTANEDDRILDVKAQRTPTGFRYTRQSAEDKKLHQQAGRRHQVAYQSLMPRADALLGWTEIDNQQFSVRERSPFKQTFPIKELDSVVRFEKMAEQWGRITALRHARADKDAKSQTIPYQFEDEVLKALVGKQREFVDFVHRVATSYARRVELDFATFQTAIDDGRLK
ncbi:MAG: hypothetical protein ACI9G1_005319, partial [Pirellulaceae bacterium]